MEGPYGYLDRIAKGVCFNELKESGLKSFISTLEGDLEYKAILDACVDHLQQQIIKKASEDTNLKEMQSGRPPISIPLGARTYLESNLSWIERRLKEEGYSPPSHPQIPEGRVGCWIL